MKDIPLKRFDMAEQLRTEEDIVAYLSMVLEEGNTEELVAALGYIAKARGMTQIAKESGLGRESLYKALRIGSRPQFDTIVKVIKALGLELKIAK